MDWISSLETRDWIAIIGVLIGAVSASIATANFLANRRQQRLTSQRPAPQVKATINRGRYDGGWRSVQLHISPTDDGQKFKYENWCIEHARLLRPANAILARAENDDYASRIFYPDNPVRELIGKAEGRPQRFALEFFIKFVGEDRGQRAEFRVTFSHVNGTCQRTVKVAAVLPTSAEPAFAEPEPVGEGRA